MELRIAGYQMAVGRDVKINTEKIIGAIDFASENNAEILLTPEGSLSGYTPEFDVCEVEGALETVTSHARNKNVGLALGTCFVEEDGKCYNQIRFYKPNGEYLGFHSKILCCGSVSGPSKGEVTHYATSDLRTFQWRDDITIGALICNDMWANPGCTPMPDSHLAQQLSAMGADIILHAVNGGRNGNDWSKIIWNYHESNLRMRARAGKIWIVTVDNSEPEKWPCAAPSGVINPSGEFVYQTNPKGEELFVEAVPLGGGQSK